MALQPLHGTEEMQRILAPCRPFPRLEHFGSYERRHATALAGKRAVPLIMLVEAVMLGYTLARKAHRAP